MSLTADRLEIAMEDRGYDQSQLARQIGVSQATINRIVQGKTANSRLLPRIATHLGVSLPWLLGMADDPATEAPSSPARREDMVEVAMVDLAYGMGGTFLAEHPDSRMEEFPLSFLRHFTKADPRQLMIAEGVGDSMAPTIGPSDLVLIDRGQDNLNVNDRIWACAILLRPRPPSGRWKRRVREPSTSYKWVERRAR